MGCERPRSASGLAARPGATTTSLDGAKEQIDELAKKYIGQDTYPYLQPGEQRVKVLLKPERIRLYKQ